MWQASPSDYAYIDSIIGKAKFDLAAYGAFDEKGGTIMASKKISFTFVGEIYNFDSMKAREAFIKSRNLVGTATLVAAKREHGVLSLEILQPLIEAAKKAHDPRQNVVEDGEHSCSFFHMDGNGQFRAQSWTLTRKAEDGTVTPVTDKEGNEIIAGAFAVKSRHALSKPGLEMILAKAEALTESLTGKPASGRLALVIAACPRVHNTREIRQEIGGTTGLTQALARLEKSEEYFGNLQSGIAQADSEFAALRAAKSDKFRRGRGGHGGGRPMGDPAERVDFPIGGVLLSAPKSDRNFVEALRDLNKEFMNRPAAFVALSPAQLAERGVPERIAPALLRRVRESLLGGSSTIGERVATDGGGRGKSKDRERTERSRRRKEGGDE